MAWSYYRKRPDTPVFATVYRETDVGMYEVVGKSRLESDTVGKTIGRAGEEVIFVKKDDFIGLHYEAGHSDAEEMVIPYAEAPDHLCSGDGDCIDGSNLHTAYALPLTDDDINVGDTIVLSDMPSKKLWFRAPALSPIFCSGKSHMFWSSALHIRVMYAQFSSQIPSILCISLILW